MTPQEALNHFEEQLCKHCCKWNKALRHCTSCPTDTAKKALEKQIPKKPHITIMGYAYSDHKRTITNCPYCYEVKGLGLWESLIDRPTPYCRRCGQAIDWSEEEYNYGNY